MIIHSLTNRIYTPWGVRYNTLKWDDNWEPFIRMQDRMCKEKLPTLVTLDGKRNSDLRHLIEFLDTNILQKIHEITNLTINVRIRILCSLTNKCSQLTWQQKYQFMENVWSTVKEFQRSYTDWYCIWIAKLPF